MGGGGGGDGVSSCVVYAGGGSGWNGVERCEHVVSRLLRMFLRTYTLKDVYTI